MGGFIISVPWFFVATWRDRVDVIKSLNSFLLLIMQHSNKSNVHCSIGAEKLCLQLEAIHNKDFPYNLIKHTFSPFNIPFRLKYCDFFLRLLNNIVQVPANACIMLHFSLKNSSYNFHISYYKFQSSIGKIQLYFLQNMKIKQKYQYQFYI